MLKGEKPPPSLLALVNICAASSVWLQPIYKILIKRLYDFLTFGKAFKFQKLDLTVKLDF